MPLDITKLIYLKSGDGSYCEVLRRHNGDPAVDCDGDYYLYESADASVRFRQPSDLEHHYSNTPPVKDYTTEATFSLLKNDTSHSTVRRTIRYGVRNGKEFIEFAD